MALPPDQMRELAYFHRRVNRFLEDTLRKAPRRMSIRIEHATWTPKVNVYRDGGEIKILVELPGVVSSDEVTLEAQAGRLVISGFRHPPQFDEDTEPLLVEGSFGPFQRVIQIPNDADLSSISASMKAGVLEIRIPEGQKRNPVRVEILGIG